MPDIKNVTLRLNVDSSGAVRGAAQYDKAVDQVAASTKNTTATVNHLIKTMGGLWLAYKGVSVVRESVKEFAAFERQMANVSTMLNEQSMRHLPQYSRQIRTLSISMGESTDTLSKGLYDILSASVPAANAMEVLEVASRAAQAGLTDTGTSADALTTILNSYGLSAEHAGKVSSDLFETVQRGKITFAELAGSIGNVASDAATAGVSLEELLGTLATMTRAGLKSEIAITSLRGIIANLRSPTDEAREAFAALGIEIDVGIDQVGGLVGVFKALAKANPEVLEAIIGDRRAVSGLNAVLQQLEGHAGDVAHIIQTSGADVQAFGKMSQATAKKLEQYDMALSDIRRTIGEAFAPALAKGATAMAGFVKDNQRYLARWASDFEEGCGFTAGVIGDFFEHAAQAPDAFIAKLDQVKDKLASIGSDISPIIDPSNPYSGGPSRDIDAQIRAIPVDPNSSVDLDRLNGRGRFRSEGSLSFTAPGATTVETGMPTIATRNRAEDLTGPTAQSVSGDVGAIYPSAEGFEDYQQSLADSYWETSKARKAAIGQMADMESAVDREREIIGRLSDSHAHARDMVEYERKAREAYADDLDTQQAKIKEYHDSIMELENAERLAKVADRIGQSFGSAFTDMITGAKTAEEAMRSLGRSILESVIEQTVTQPIANAVSGMIGTAFSAGMSGGVSSSGGFAAAPYPVHHHGGIVGQDYSRRHRWAGLFDDSERLALPFRQRAAPPSRASQQRVSSNPGARGRGHPEEWCKRQCLPHPDCSNLQQHIQAIRGRTGTR